MAEFKAFTSGVKVNGAAVLAVIHGMTDCLEEANHILSEHGIDNPEADTWFPQQAWLDAFHAIYERYGEGKLLEIGRKIPETAKFPENIKGIAQGLELIDAAYRINHQGGGIGFYRFESMGPSCGRMVCRNPYPCAFDKGIIEGVAEKYKPSADITVRVEEEEGMPCRHHGADTCIYLVDWSNATHRPNSRENEEAIKTGENKYDKQEW